MEELTLNEIKQKWKEVLEALKTQISSVSFNTWFAPLEPVELRANEIILCASMSFAKNIIEHNYCEMISEALFCVFGYPVSPVVMTEDELKSYEKNRPKVDVPQNETDFGLLPNFTFDNFVVGGSNRLAHAASLAVAEMPGQSYNPLYLYGHSGLGKTHLMHAIGNYMLGRNPFAKMLYVTSEVFTNELINAIRTNTTAKFREKYRQLDLLLIDDIQFISGKIQTEEEFFHTFNHLHQAHKQIIVSGDRPPSEMTTLEERIKTRLMSDMMADLQPPDYETRMAILKKRCANDDCGLSDDVLEFIAENVVKNIRELNGALTRVKAYASLNGGKISSETAANVLKDVIAPAIKNFTFEQIQRKVSEFYDVPVEDMVSEKRSKEINTARQVAIHICRTLTPSSLKKIGEAFNRNYATVINALDRVESQLHIDASLKNNINSIIHALREE
ncbi:MAG: chromosomal replication initiator protein DnaA [Bacillota bacterium]|nr:chromosomal replication initiator protein DnaA [Bacillota bacterium]